MKKLTVMVGHRAWFIVGLACVLLSIGAGVFMHHHPGPLRSRDLPHWLPEFIAFPALLGVPGLLSMCIHALFLRRWELTVDEKGFTKKGEHIPWTSVTKIAVQAWQEGIRTHGSMELFYRDADDNMRTLKLSTYNLSRKHFQAITELMPKSIPVV